MVQGGTMTKTYTEQWREGTLLDGAYYILVDKYEQNEPEIDVGVCYNSNFEWWIVKEVLAPVPRYEQFIGLMYDSKELDKAYDKINLLEKRLAIATKALNDILNDGDDYWDKDKAQKALTKMKGVK